MRFEFFSSYYTCELVVDKPTDNLFQGDEFIEDGQPHRKVVAHLPILQVRGSDRESS